MAIATLRFSISHLACPDVRVSPLRFSQRLMVAVVQLVEHLVVVQDVAGSSPVSHPIAPALTRRGFCFCSMLVASSFDRTKELSCPA